MSANRVPVGLVIGVAVAALVSGWVIGQRSTESKLQPEIDRLRSDLSQPIHTHADDVVNLERSLDATLEEAECVLDDVQTLGFEQKTAVTDCITVPRAQKQYDGDDRLQAAIEAASQCFVQTVYNEARRFGIARGGDGERTLDNIQDACWQSQ
jgi:hypothetical protein